MEYRHLGRSGLKVSELSFGSWLTFHEALDTRAAERLMKHAFEQGVNFFDNAEGYAAGRSEEVMGKALRSFARESLVVSTKIFFGGEGPNDKGLSRKHLVEGTKRSLKRLGLEYVDLLFCHRPDPDTPVEETVLAMDMLVRSGLVLYWGTSEWPAERIAEAYEIAARTNSIAPTMEQPRYHLFSRERVEREYAPLYERYGLGTTIWSPLASGVLTGKYNDGIPKGSRLDEQRWLQKEITPERIAAVRQLTELARELGCTIGQLAIAWCLKNPHVSTVILGATKLEQLTENLGATEVKAKLTPDVRAEIDRITGGGAEVSHAA